ncbi:MAG: carbohydrate ABC transporter permease, partial [Oscillospiraceae bacterium]|nr:carbohydrate ABC transporter permease [Oscillospiraceae bacterium]
MYSTNKTMEKIKTVLDAFFKLVLIFIMAFPFFWMISTALQTLKETLSVPLTLWPEKLQWVNFSEVFDTIAVGTY